MKWIGHNKIRIGKKDSPEESSIEILGHNMRLIFNKTLGKIQFTNNGVSINDLGGGSGGDSLSKSDYESPAFTKTAASTLSVKAGTAIEVNGTKVLASSPTSIIMPTLSEGTDYAIYACDDGSWRASDNFSAPSGYTTINSKKVGGFHFGLVSTTETVAGGSFAITGTGMKWVQGDVDKIKGINAFSIWDLRFRPLTRDPRGMALISNSFWVDIYLCGTNHPVNGTSKYNSDVASGTVLPKIPTEFNGDGTLTYASGTWWNFSEIAKSHGKRLMTLQEFAAAAFGVTEAQSLGGPSTTITNTKRQAGYTSKHGLEQASGHHWTWGAEISGSYAALFSGARVDGASSGSRASYWSHSPSDSYWNFGLRAACDHLKL